MVTFATETIEKQENSMNTERVDNNSNIFNEAKNIIDGTDKKMEISQFNGPIKIYNGTQIGVGVKSVLDTVITSNKTKENKIKVKFHAIFIFICQYYKILNIIYFIILN